MNAAVLVLRLVIGGILVVAGALKVGHPTELASAIAGFRILPASIVGPVALALPYIELLLGAYLIVGLFTRFVATVTAVQFAAYAAAIGSAVVRHIPASCGCFGPNDTAAADWPHVIFDIVLFACSVLVAWRAPGALAVDRRFGSA